MASLTVSSGGAVTGVVLESGEAITARSVLGACDPRTTLTRLLADRLELPEEPTKLALPGGGSREPVIFADAADLPEAEIHWLCAGMVRWGWISYGRRARSWVMAAIAAR